MFCSKKSNFLSLLSLSIQAAPGSCSINFCSYSKQMLTMLLTNWQQLFLLKILPAQEAASIIVMASVLRIQGKMLS